MTGRLRQAASTGLWVLVGMTPWLVGIAGCAWICYQLMRGQ
jgi:hypothetical protein